ncbi:hypothetical protein PENTCL1PPCAC_26557, partial [Pristionchus entomophagus]
LDSMWKSLSPSPAKGFNGRSNSLISLRSNSLLQRAVSLQFLNRGNREKQKSEMAKIRLRYADTARAVIWPHCRYVVDEKTRLNQQKMAPLAEGADRISEKFLPVEMEDDRSPYPPCAINAVLRSDSEDSEDDIDQMTRL